MAVGSPVLTLHRRDLRRILRLDLREPILLPIREPRADVNRGDAGPASISASTPAPRPSSSALVGLKKCCALHVLASDTSSSTFSPSISHTP